MNTSTIKSKSFPSQQARSDVEARSVDLGASANGNQAAAEARTSASEKADIRLSLAGYYLVIFFGKEKRSSKRLAEEREKHPVLSMNNAPVLGFVWLSVMFTLYSIIALCVRGLSVLVS